MQVFYFILQIIKKIFFCGGEGMNVVIFLLFLMSPPLQHQHHNQLKPHTNILYISVSKMQTFQINKKNDIQKN